MLREVWMSVGVVFGSREVGDDYRIERHSPARFPKGLGD